MAPHDGVLRVLSCVAGALAFLVVEKVAAKREKIMRREFLLQKADRGIFGCRAALLSCEAIRSVRTGFWPNTTAHCRHVALIHIPALARNMDGLRKLVIPGSVILL